MARRVSLPGAEELFRPTIPGETRETPQRATDQDEPVADSGRVKHDEKMTVYLTVEELMAIEQARIRLRAELGRSVDRGRFVRAAIAGALADLDARDGDSDVARRLSQS